MKHVKDSQLVRPHWRRGPQAAWLDGFADRVNAQGYAPHTVYRKILMASCFGQWLLDTLIDVGWQLYSLWLARLQEGSPEAPDQP